MRRIVRLALLAFGAVWVGAMIGAIRAKQTIEPIDEPEADEVVLTGIFDQLAFRSTARAFRGGDIECWFGGGVVDLRGATLDPAGATLRVRAIFGGGQLVVPSTWRVTIIGRAGFGGIADARGSDAQPESGPELVVEGLALFGGFAVTTDLDEKADQWLSEAAATDPTTAGADALEMITDN